MSGNPRKVSVSGTIIVLLIVLTAIILQHALINDEKWYWCLLLTIPAIALIAVFTGNKQVVIK